MLHAKQIEFTHPTTREKTKNRSTTTTIFWRSDRNSRKGIKTMEENEERLQKYLARKGIASRRKCEEYIEQGLVKVNGNVVTELGTKINPSKDKIIFKRKRNKK